MVYTSKDIAHLEVMAELDAAVPVPIDIKKVLALDSISLPTDLTSNIITLATKLRSEGFIAYADQLEEKLLAYKTADVHLYRVHDEDGEDLVDRAHPDGDVNMGDGEHGDVETIVSRHKKIVDVVNKKPSGKLGTYVSACKIALGQDKAQEDAISNYMEKIKQNISEIMTLARKEMNSGAVGAIFGFFGAANLGPEEQHLGRISYSTDWSNLVSLKHWLTLGLRPTLQNGLAKETWDQQVEPLLKDCDTYIDDALKLRKQALDLERKERTQSPQSNVVKDYGTVLQSISLYKEQVAKKGLPNAKDLSTWLDEAAAEVKQNLEAYSQTKQTLQSDKEYEAKLVTIKTQLNAMVKKWLV